MAIWKDSNGVLHDDMDGGALGIDSWPADATLLTNEEVEEHRKPTSEQLLQQRKGEASAALAATDEQLSEIHEAIILAEKSSDDNDYVALIKYRRDLRTIVQSTDCDSIPELPELATGNKK
jgi:hypothetical protein